MPPLLIDTHCHLNFDSYEPDRAEVIARADAAGVTRTIIPAVDVATTRESLALAEQHPGKIFATSGIHPNSTADFDAAMLAEIEALKAGSRQVLLDWRARGDPVQGLRAALRHCGVL